MARPAKPVSLHLANGNKRCLTKAEIEHRQKNEIKLGNQSFVCPDNVVNDKIALDKWNELMVIYSDIEFVGTADAGILERYCMLTSDLYRLRKIQSLEWTKYERGEITFEAYNKVEQAINKKNELLVKIEDRIFLNPVCRIKNVAKKEESEELTEEQIEVNKLFGD